MAHGQKPAGRNPAYKFMAPISGPWVMGMSSYQYVLLRDTRRGTVTSHSRRPVSQTPGERVLRRDKDATETTSD